MNHAAAVLRIGAIALVLTGCSSMSGLDAKSNFSCKAPDGILCESMSGIYANAQAKNLPGQKVNKHTQEGAADSPHANETGVMTKPIYSGTPIRSAPRLLRVWIAPWEDTDGDLHDQSYVYLTIDSGQWLIEHNRRRILDNYRPVRAPTSAKGALSRENAQTPPNLKNGNSLSPERAAELMKGISTPGNVVPDSE